MQTVVYIQALEVLCIMTITMSCGSLNRPLVKLSDTLTRATSASSGLKPVI